jgi:hypothetical protein
MCFTFGLSYTAGMQIVAIYSCLKVHTFGNVPRTCKGTADYKFEEHLKAFSNFSKI